MDIDPGTVVSSISTLWALMKDLREQAKSRNDTETLDKLIEIQCGLADLSDENRTLIERIRELEKGRKVEAHYNAYWVREENGIDGPFDLGPYDTERKYVRLISWGQEARDLDHFRFGERGKVVVPVLFLKDHINWSEIE